MPKIGTAGNHNIQIDPAKQALKDLRYAVIRKEKELEIKAKKLRDWKNRRGFSSKYAICTQCKGKMRKDIGDIQIENKRENAPICFACIEGKPRVKYN